MHDGIGHMVTPPGRHPLGRHPPGQAPPPRDGQSDGGTHPTGMHSCYYRQPLLNHIYDDKYVKQPISGERY